MSLSIFLFPRDHGPCSVRTQKKELNAYLKYRYYARLCGGFFRERFSSRNPPPGGPLGDWRLRFRELPESVLAK
jgi:hypothetical protein